MLYGGKQLVHGTCMGVREDNKDICPMVGSQVKGWVQLLAGTSKEAEWPKGPNPVLRDPHGLDQSQ